MASLVQTASGSISAAFASPVSPGNMIVVALAAPDLSKVRVFRGPIAGNRAVSSECFDIVLAKGTGISVLLAYFKITYGGPLIIEAEHAPGCSLAAFELQPSHVTYWVNEISYSVSAISLAGPSVAAGSGTSADAGPTVPTAGPGGVMVITAVGLSAPATVTTPSGFTAGPGQSESSSNAGLATAYVNGGNGAQGQAFGLSASQAWAAAAVAFSEQTGVIGEN